MSLFYCIRINEDGILTLSIQFEREELEFEIGDFFRVSKTGKPDRNLFTLFDAINDYFKTLPLEHQKELFLLYKKIDEEDYKLHYNDSVYIELLESHINYAVKLLNYNQFKLYIYSRSHELQLPKDIQEEFIYDPNMNTIREKTYIKSEYIDLIAMILFIRALTPLYLDYFNYIRQLTPFYFYRVFLLFANCDDIDKSEEINKLRQYIDVNKATIIDKSKNNMNIINNGFSDDDMIDALVAEVIFGKLIAIDFFNDNANFIAFIYQTIRYKGKFNVTTEEAIKNKTALTDANKEDMSYFEDYRKISSISLGTIVEIQHALSDLSMIIRCLGKEKFDYNLYQEELSHIHEYETNRLDNVQITLLGWFLNKYINPRALYYIDYRKLVEMILFAKVVLKCHGLEFMSALISATISHEIQYVNVNFRYGSQKANFERLKPYFGFVMLEENKTNVIEETLEKIHEEIIGNTWIVHGNTSEKLIKDGGILIIPENLMTHLVDFVLFTLE